MSDRSPTFAIIGANGYIAPRHGAAISAVGGRLVGACDNQPNGKLGWMDSVSRDVEFFPDIEHFDRWLDRRNRGDDPIDYVVVCTPNWMHDTHCRLAMRSGSDVICEKPVTLTTRNVDALREVEIETGQRVHCILQLRHHDGIRALHDSASESHDVVVRYNAPRGVWYSRTWKGDPELSGGVATNIGVHLFDALVWCFGDPIVRPSARGGALSKKGTLALERATVLWNLSVSDDRAERTFTVDGETVDCTNGIADLHEASYRSILAGEGWGLDDARPAIELCEELR